MPQRPRRRRSGSLGRIVAAGAIGAGLILWASAARAQTMTVLPVNISLPPGQETAVLTVINQGADNMSVQIRALAWSQPGGKESLTSSDDVAASPPIVTIPPGARQVVRVILLAPPRGNEATYRVLLDQIPPPASPGTVRLAMRLSIPVFAKPPTRVFPKVSYHVESVGGQAALVAVNQGGSHDTLRDIALTTSGGSPIKVASNASPYILAGATRRWQIADGAAVSGTLRLRGHSESGPVDVPVSIVSGP